MARFRCIPVPSAVPEQFRTGVDGYGNAVRAMPARHAGAPCRHCLRYAAEGEAMLLGSYALPRPQGIYWTPSPIFVHADPCPAYGAADEVAEVARLNTLVSVRAYDAGDQCLYDLGMVCDGSEVDDPLQRALADARTAFVNIHTARPGCWLCRVERV